MKKILITQRFEKIVKFNELRDNLDVRLSSLFFKLGYIPVPVPTNSVEIFDYIKQISPSGIILSGGGDPRKIDERYVLEKKLLYISKKNSLFWVYVEALKELIFILKEINKNKNHVRKKHFISGPSLKKNLK